MGRRPAHSGPICRLEKPLADAYAMARSTEALPAEVDVPTWWALAKCREVFKAFSTVLSSSVVFERDNSDI